MSMRPARLALLILATGFLLPLTEGAAQELSLAPASRPVYYTVEPDRRLCPSPVCGGYFISAVNRRATPCADGSMSASCYVADIDWEAIGLNGSEGAGLVLGTQERGDFPGFSELAVLVPEAAWRAASDQEPRGRWFGLMDNGIVCVTTPCFDIDQRKLNRRNRVRAISDIDLSRVRATDEDLEAAWQALENDELIAVGVNRRVRDAGPAGTGLEFVAFQFFVRLERELDRDLFCTADEQCVATSFHSFVSSPDECYCPLCPDTVLNRKAEQRNRESWGEFCPDYGFLGGPPPVDPSAVELRGIESPGLPPRPVPKPIICPLVLCIAPPPVACVENQCTFLDREPLPY